MEILFNYYIIVLAPYHEIFEFLLSDTHMLSRSIKRVSLLRSRTLAVSAFHTFATPSNDGKGKAKESHKDAQKPTTKPEFPKGLEGFFQQYQQSQRKPQESFLQGSDKDPDKKKRSNNEPPPNNNGFFNNQVAWIVGSASAYLFWSSSSSVQSKEITWQEFRTAFLDKGLVDSLTVVNKHRVRVKLHSNASGVMQNIGGDYYFSIGSVEAFERKLDNAQDELGIPSSERIPVSYLDEISSFGAFFNFAPSLLIMGVLYWMVSRRGAGGSGGGIFSIGKSRAKLFNKDTEVKVKFKDVAGMDEAKEEIMEFV